MTVAAVPVITRYNTSASSWLSQTLVINCASAATLASVSKQTISNDVHSPVYKSTRNKSKGGRKNMHILSKPTKGSHQKRKSPKVGTLSQPLLTPFPPTKLGAHYVFQWPNKLAGTHSTHYHIGWLGHPPLWVRPPRPHVRTSLGLILCSLYTLADCTSGLDPLSLLAFPLGQ